MPYEITRFEDTPNPNAVKCWLDRPISDGPRSFRAPADAADDPIAGLLFERTGVTNVFFCGDWLTVNKRAEARWADVKKTVRAVLAAAPDPT